MKAINKLKIFHNRYIENKYIDLDKLPNLITEEILPLMELELQNLVKIQIESSPLKENYILNSLNEKEYNYSIYNGTGSNLFIFWRYYLLCENKYKDKIKEAFEYFKISINSNLSNWKFIEKKYFNSGGKIPPSFFMGPVGIYTMSVIYFRIAKDQILFQNYLDKIIDYRELAMNKYSENELLYGSAGYIYCLLLIKQNCSDNLSEKNISLINESLLIMIKYLFNEGVNNMKSFNSSILIWPWPKSKVKHLSDVYLGAAHGVIGILHMLINGLYCLQINPYDLLDDEIKNILIILKQTLDNLLEMRYSSGNFPSSIGKEKDSLVHFCHGQIGAIPLFISAYNFYKDEKYLDAVLLSGKDLWTRGLLLKGNGICHGISGGAYSLFSIYKVTNDFTWRNRAFLFANATCDEDIQNICTKYEDPQRLITGKPDTPFSLMEGQGAIISLFSDLLNDEEFVKFPGYEI